MAELNRTHFTSEEAWKQYKTELSKVTSSITPTARVAEAPMQTPSMTMDTPSVTPVTPMVMVMGTPQYSSALTSALATFFTILTILLGVAVGWTAALVVGGG